MAAGGSDGASKASGPGGFGFGSFSRWLAIILGLSLLSLLVTSSYNQLLSTAVGTPTDPHQSTLASNSSSISTSSDRNSTVVWLLSFPNSGTSYTLVNTQTVSNRTVATSYDQEILYSGPPRHVGAEGRSPYLLNDQLERPRLVLTKTHCVGHCETCAPEPDVAAFERECLTITRSSGGGRRRNQRVPYGGPFPAKAVHLFRDPHDNLVARMHMGVARRRDRLGWTERDLAPFTDDSAGFGAWCTYIDSVFQGDLKGRLRREFGIPDHILDNVPCLSEWWRYVQWHNNAIAMLKAHKVPALVLYYEEYTESYKQVLDELFEFLELRKVNAPVPFVEGKTYGSYFGEETKRLAAELVQRLATPTCWNIIKGYFPEETTRFMVPRTKVASSDNLPVVALLLSFPNSGTSYTLKNTMVTSNLSVATNYVQEVQNNGIPVVLLRPDVPRSPYVLKPAFQLPHRVLTKTHCAGYCEQCEAPPLAEFEYHCLARTRNAKTGKSAERSPYSSDLVERTIHLFRDPFDNLVARMHLGIDRRRVVKHWSDKELSVFANTPKGLKAWCQELDSMYRGDFDQTMRDMDVPAELHRNLPCKTDWFRYVMWHNTAVDLIERWGVPNQVVYYEDYTQRYNDTVADILKFLDLKAVHSNYPFYSGKTYHNLYDDETGRKAAAFLQHMASPKCWQLIRHYFAPYLDSKAAAESKVVWLLSYPNSGTSYTILNTEQITNASTATNHGQEVREKIALRPDVADGPFIHRPTMNVPHLVLTKTHCTGYNFQGGPAASLDVFKTHCLTATWSAEGGGLRNSMYSEGLVVKAVHLVRSPFDNLVSRMHHAIKNAGKLKLSTSFVSSISSEDHKANLRNWCTYVDGLPNSDASAVLQATDADFMDVPCHTELVRYISWHNRALEMTDSMQLPLHVLHYEDYTAHFNETVKNLYKFLEQPILKAAIPFEDGKTYLDHFEADHIRVLSRVIKSLASDMTLSLVGRYLQDEGRNLPAFPPRQARKLVWLLSFPNSGTSYTITNTQRMTNTSAASNYMAETKQIHPMAVRPDLKNGPFLLKNYHSVPQFVLTKTHCAGYCDACSSTSFLNTVETFELGCRETHAPGHTNQSHYQETPVRSVHIFRNILDNLVARKHLGMEIRVGKDESLRQSRMNEDSHEGFIAWCSYTDQLSSEGGGLATFLNAEQLALSKDVICAYEVFRYIQWHNLALEMTQKLDIPVHYIYYEDYATNYDKTINELAQFLDIPIVGPTIEFARGKNYDDIFDDNQARSIALFARSLATKECWDHISRYLDKWIDNKTPDSIAVPSPENTNPKIAWLLSFPNSGTSYTLTNTIAMTGSSVATNYANEVDQLIPVRPDLDHSPFILRSGLRTDPLVLTKTHCNVKDNIKEFLDGCRMLRSADQKGIAGYTYPTSLVGKAVHIIRDIYNNLVARMHHGMANRINQGIFNPSLRNETDGESLFHSWCQYIDKKYWAIGQNKKWVSKKASQLLDQVPCYTDVLHYVIWHNMAIEALAQEQIPVYHLYYEDYETSFERSTLRLYDEFLNFPIIGKPVEFIRGKSYHAYFTDTEALAVARLVYEVATPKCWSLIRHYFSKWLGELEKTELAPAAWPGQSRHVKIAWLLSFPNSGTTFTLANTETISNSTTAANYAQGHDACVPVRPGLDNGPFIHNLNLAVPSVVLSKTHCAGYCDDCNLSRSFMTLETFERGCGSGQKRVGHKFVPSYYPSSVPDRIVHLIRNPIDNAVSRMHHGVMRRKEFLGWSGDQLMAYSHSKEGMHRWCTLIDDGFWDKASKEANLLPESTRIIMNGVPCAGDFFRYTQWHNLAVELIEKLGLESHRLYYEDYTKDFKMTTDHLFQFLGLPKINEPFEFKPGKTYGDFFEADEFMRIARLVRELATDKTWSILQRYFPNEEERPFNLSRAAVEVQETKVVWLMSFPNSGTSYTITNLKEITQKATATNYMEGDNSQFRPLFSGQPEGPYVKEPFYESPEYVLTKTHCDGYCDMCDQEATRQTLDSFEIGCASGTRYVNGEKEFVSYSSSIPKKAVHLIRNGYDNIVARMHLGIVKRRKGGWSEVALSQFNDTAAGILAWCKYVDGRFQENKQDPLFTEDQKKLLSQLPCFSEWFRYVQWHNMAIKVIEKLQIPYFTLFYENYTTAFDSTVEGLLDFMEIKQVKKSKNFIPGKTYQNLFYPEHKQIAFNVVKMFASTECWKLLRHYFEESDASGTS